MSEINQAVLLTTTEAAAMLRRKPQTLRKWSCLAEGPIRPVPFSRRGPLLWRLADVEAVIAESGPGENRRDCAAPSGGDENSEQVDHV